MTYKNQHTIGARPADLATVPRGSMKGWDVAGYDMCDAVKFFLPFPDGSSPNMNMILIVLI